MQVIASKDYGIRGTNRPSDLPGREVCPDRPAIFGRQAPQPFPCRSLGSGLWDGPQQARKPTGSHALIFFVAAGTVAVVRSSDFLRASERATAISTLIRQRRLTPSCGGHAPTAKRTVGPARIAVESLTPRPGIREQNRPVGDIRC